MNKIFSKMNEQYLSTYGDTPTLVAHGITLSLVIALSFSGRHSVLTWL